jgi:hypothetical protein
MNFNFLHKKSETEEERILRHADIIVANADYNGVLDNDCLDVFGILTKDKLPPILAKIRSELRALQPASNGDLEPIKAFIGKNYDDVRNHLLNNGYIDKPDHTQNWILNDKGKLMKELGGHRKYKKYRKREINILQHQNTINWLLFSAAAASAIMPFIVAIYFTPNNIINLPQQNQPPYPNDTVIARQLVEEILKEKDSAQRLKATELKQQAKTKHK